MILDRRRLLTGTGALLGTHLLGGKKVRSSALGPVAKGDLLATYRFKLGIWLSELKLPFEQELDAAKEMGAEYIWFEGARPGETRAVVGAEPCISSMSDAAVYRMGELVAHRGLKFYQICAYRPFHNMHLVGLKRENLRDNPDFRLEFDSLIRSMQIASQLGVGAVHSYGFCWPGEWSVGQPTWSKAPTWPMRWLTRGGVIAEVDFQKLVAAFSLVLEQAEKYDVDLVLGMRPFNYMSSTDNFRRLAEKLGSNRFKVQWSPADNVLIGEWDAATTGFTNLRPYLHGLHLKDVHVIDGLKGKYEWRPIGQGKVGYRTVLQNLRDHRIDAILMVATHFRPPGGTNLDAMRINFANVKSIIRQIEEGA